MKIKNVIIMSNGLVAIFDYNDNQIIELQGTIFESLYKIKEYVDIDTKFRFEGKVLNLEWYFEKDDKND